MEKGIKYVDPEREKVGIGATVERRIKDLLKKEKNYSALINELLRKHYKLEK